MNRLSKAQKEKVVQFRSITGATDKVAAQCLQVAEWSVEGAIEEFFGGGMAAASAAQAKPGQGRGAEAAFAKYRDAEEGIINVDGVQRLCADLQVDPMDVTLLVFAWHCQAAAMCEFTQAEFCKGMTVLGCDTVEKLRTKLPYLKSELRDEQKFKGVYEYAYDFCREKGQKCVHLEVALAMWRLLFQQKQWPLAERWCTYVVEHHKRAISRDTWMQLYDFIQTVKPDLSNFEDNSAWPYLIDEFVEHLREGASTEKPMELD